MNQAIQTHEQLVDEVADLRARLTEASDTLHAIRNGEVDAVLALGPQGDQLFTLKAADDPYRVLIEEMNQGAVSLSADGLILYCNRRFSNLVKLPQERIVGHAFHTFVTPPDSGSFAALLEASLAHSSAGEITLRASDNGEVPLQLALGPLPKNSAAAICLIATDISESREKEARLRTIMAALVETEMEAEVARAEAERANAAKSEFLANMSHEIRTPMNGIIGMTNLVLESRLNSAQRGDLGMVKSSAHSLLGLINDILDFSKIEAGKLELESIDFKLRDCMAEMFKPLVIRGQQKGLVLRTDITADVREHLVGDPLRLRQILLNFVDNALKFTHQGSIVVKIAAEAGTGGEQCLHFSVSDTGIGIPPEKRDVIFQAFAQADGSTTRHYGGTGLGLAIASRLVAQMRGKIWIESTFGKGTTFHFTAWFGVPAGSPPGESLKTPKIEPAGFLRRGAGTADALRILVAEDNVINRALTTGLLEKRGHCLVHAADGQEALAAAAREAFDLIFMDVQMPGMDGLEATRRIRAAERAAGNGWRTPIVAMTAHALSGDRARCLAAGMDDYLSKPLDKAHLLTLLECIPGRGRRPKAIDISAASSESMPLEPEVGPSDEINSQHCIRIARYASLFVIVIGLSVLVGWLLDFRPLMTVLPGLVSMKPNTALGLCLTGLSLFLSTAPDAEGKRHRGNLSTAFAAAAGILGALTLWQYTTGFQLGIDELLFRDSTGSRAPGRMAPLTAFNFGFLGLALVLLRFPKRTAWTHALTAGAALSSLLAIVGYFYGVTALYQAGSFTAVAVHTAVSFLALCIGVWCVTNHYGFMRVVTGRGTSGKLMRIYGLASIVLPLLFTWLRLQEERAGWCGQEFSALIFALAHVITFFTLIWLGSASLRTAERKEAQVRESLRQAQFDLEERVLRRTSELAEANAVLKEQMFERAKAEDDIQQILNHSLDIICTIDGEGRFLRVSQACEMVWGYRPEELVGRNFLELVHPEDREKTIAIDGSILDGQPVNDFENRYVRRDGTAVSMLWSAKWSEAQQTNFCVARDITARKQMEGELLTAKETAESANRAKSEFLANMSHEIRTPMNGIIGMTDLVLETELDREQREYLGLAKSSADSLLGLINAILDFSKIEAGKLEVESIAFGLRDCIGTMLKPLGLRADRKGLELTADIPAVVPDHVVGDPMRLRQILINLIDNAIKFTEHGDVVLRVTTESVMENECRLHFSIADTGIGIPAGKQSIIFDAFAQADGTTTRTYGGTGLGLAIASQLVRQMGGRIWVESAVGQGTTFHFTAQLPVLHTPAPSARQADPRQLEDLRVLVVDDNAVNRRVLQETLLNWRMQPVVARSGVAGLVELLRAARAGTPFKLVILDGAMPEMDGFTVAEKIREHPELSNSTVMMLTSGMPSGAAARCLELGVASYLTKPVLQSELLEAILTAIGAPAGGEAAMDPAQIERAAIALRILVAEDNVINRALTTGLLEKRGHCLVHAADGQEALAAAAREAFDLIFMDVQMPGMDGLEATRRIRAAERAAGNGWRTPIVAMTAHALSGDRARCLAAGMDDYLSKPLDKAHLLTLLTRIGTGNKTQTHVVTPHASTPHAPPDTLRAAAPAEAGYPDVPPIFSREMLLDQFDGDEALLQQIITLFQKNTPSLMQNIRAAVSRRRAHDVSRSAHALLSSLGVLGAKDAHRLAQQIEDIGTQDDFSRAGETLAKLERAMDEVFAAIRRLTYVCV